ncbi:MAG: TraR/DksA family transcriptional regulator [Bdellovibrionales bacterium]|nr:TraR/DksA family transcriptional regulator [Bdellovibrionales bacterium]
MSKLDNLVIQECKIKLINKKKEVLNRLHELARDFNSLDKGRDEVDLSTANLAENQYLSTNKQLREMILEIDAALFRIQSGHFGFCEETDELIELPRLMSIPWTRLSIEGAEIRESLKSRYLRV